MAESSLREVLEGNLAPGRLALLRKVAERAAGDGNQLYVVGGFVRDLLLGTPSQDFDFVVEGDAIGLAYKLARDYGGQVHSHRRFGTAKWILDQQNEALHQALEFEPGDLPERLDFVTARSESYERPTALPSVREGDIRGDLERRDFSINALALRLDGPQYGELLEVENGLHDLEHKRIRVLHSDSFEDDPTRALRAVRLEQRLGFEIEQKTLELMQRALPLMAAVSGERIRSELQAIFVEPEILPIMRRLHELGLLGAIHTDLIWDDWLAARFGATLQWSAPEDWQLENQPPTQRLLYGLWVCRLSEPSANSICDRLMLSQADRAVALRTGRQSCELELAHDPSKLVRCLERLPEAALAATWLALEGEPTPRHAIERYLKEWRWVRPSVDGNRLHQMGLPPGPAYGRILNQLRDAWLDGEISDPEAEADLLSQLVKSAGRDG